MAIAKILCLSDPNKLWMYVDKTRVPNVKYITIYDDKNENHIGFALEHDEMKNLAEFLLRYLDND